MSEDRIGGEQWWLVAPQPGLVLWARLRERDDGAAEVLDSTGMTLRFASRDEAQHYLLDLDYRAHDGLDEEDARALGAPLAALVPPAQAEGPALVAAMNQRLGATR